MKQSLNETELVIQRLEFEISELKIEIDRLNAQSKVDSIETEKHINNERKWKTRYEVLEEEFYNMQRNHNEMVSEVMRVGAKIVEKD